MYSGLVPNLPSACRNFACRNFACQRYYLPGLLRIATSSSGDRSINTLLCEHHLIGGHPRRSLMFGHATIVRTPRGSGLANFAFVVFSLNLVSEKCVQASRSCICPFDT